MDKVLKIQNLIRESKNIVFLSGAGISTNSGLPDFRSDNGFWKTNKPIMFRDFLSSHEARQLSWERNIALNETIERIKPNTGHLYKELSLKPFHRAISNNEEIPNCPSCFGLVKVATISFGQPMNMNDFERSKDKIIESDILIVLGSSLQVQPVASLPGFAVQNGKKLIIINKDPTSFDQYAEVCIHEDICNTVAKINI